MKYFLFTLILIQSFYSFGNSTFGKISKENLQKKSSEIDESAEAELLFNNCSISFFYDQANGFKVKKTIHKRLKVYDKDEANEWLTVNIPLYQKEKSSQIKAATYTLRDNKINSEKVAKKEMYLEKTNENWSIQKFTFQNIEDGCIIEWKYTITTPYFWNLDTWYFQQDIPVLYSSYSLTIPEYFIYQPHYRGFEPHQEIKNSIGQNTIDIGSNPVTFPTQRTEHIYTNLPGLKEENYVFNINNFRNSVTYELSSYEFPGRPTQSFSSTWKSVSKTLSQHENFGKFIYNTKNAVKEIQNIPIFGEDIPTDQKIKAIYNSVKNAYSFNGLRSIYASEKIQTIAESKTGNVADINFMLIRALRRAGISAYPVVLSTNDHGIINNSFPSISQLNYVIVSVKLEDQTYLMDASSKYSNINTLPYQCLNYQGYIIYENDYEKVNISNSKQVKMTSVTCSLNENFLVEGTCKETLYGHRTIRNRKNLESSKLSVIEEIKTQNVGVSKADINFENSNEVNSPFITSYTFSSDANVQIISDKIFLDPLLYFSQVDNPFKTEERKFPVEIGSAIQENCDVTFELPAGYTVEYLPDSKRFKLPDGFGSYVISYTQSDSYIKVSRMLKLNKPIYNTDEVAILKNMFLEILKLEKEKIILAKT